MQDACHRPHTPRLDLVEGDGRSVVARGPDSALTGRMKKILCAVCPALIAISFIGLPSAALAQHRIHRMQAAPSVFRVRLADPAPAGTTFWVAYGPVAGQFGLVQLHRVGSGAYEVDVRLPQTGRTTFSFVAGQGEVKADFGAAPGNPVTTIGSYGPMSVTQVHTLTVTWHAPVG